MRHRFGTRDGASPWSVLLLVCLAAAALTEATLLELTTSYFTSGYNAVSLDSPAVIGGFFVTGAILDAALALAIWSVLVPTLRVLPLGHLQVFCLTGLVTLAVPFLFDLVRYQILSILGRMVGASLLWEVSGRSSAEVASHAAGYLSPLAVVAGIGAIGVLGVWAGAGWLERHVATDPRRFAPPPARRIWAGFAVTTLAAIGILLVATFRLDRIRYGLVNRPSGVLLTEVVQRLSDVDRDGYGLLSRPRDPAPFDAGIAPFALERPGNGIDEDGIGGDLPADFAPPGTIPPAVASATGSPHVLLIFLESFRTDLLDARFRGREVTPFLNRLAREGSLSRRAYVHSPFTVPSRAQLLGGTLVPHPGQRTLVHDFKGRGYRVGWFSGQDDSFGQSEPLLGTAEADVFYDARQDLARRTSRSTSPGSLQVSWKQLNERALAFLHGHDPEVPLFLYVNVVDTHFPYHHREIDDLLGVDPIPRSRIRAGQTGRLWETYLNTAANVDHAVEALVEAWWVHLGSRRSVILVTADHGQSFYETGFLGHGQALDEHQTAVPLILWGLGGEWPEPLGLGELRGLLWRHLDVGAGAGRPRARFVPDPSRAIFQYVPRMEQPQLVGLRRLDRSVVYDLHSGGLQITGPDGERLRIPREEKQAALQEVVWTWEALRVADAERVQALAVQ